MSTWILARDELPPLDTDVLVWPVTSHEHKYCVARRAQYPGKPDERWFWAAWDFTEDPVVTHWMPLPEPPR
jgi:hypothetical protein